MPPFRRPRLTRRPLLQRGRLAPARQHNMLVHQGLSRPSLPHSIQPIELRRWFLASAVPMVGFGFVDNTVMIHAGNFIDLTLGVTFGLSTLAAAACGQICSDVAGVAGGAQLEALFSRLGLPRPNLTPAQRSTPLVRRIGLIGQIVGVFCGCSLGMVNLLFIDTGRIAEIKAISRERSAFSIHLSNDDREDATSIIVEGPDVPMLIASLTAVLANQGCDVLGFSGGADEEHEGRVRDVFYVTRDGEQVDEALLGALARDMLDACADCGNKESLVMANVALRKENAKLHAANESLRRRAGAFVADDTASKDLSGSWKSDARQLA